MSTENTARGLRLIAQTLDGLPGLPQVSVTVNPRSISLQIVRDSADEATRRTAVEVALALMGGSTPTDTVYADHSGQGSYGGHAGLGEFRVDVYTPLVGLKVPEQRAS